jgi:hypothetical protein
MSRATELDDLRKSRGFGAVTEAARAALAVRTDAKGRGNP